MSNVHEVEFFGGPQDGAKHTVPDTMNVFYFVHLNSGSVMAVKDSPEPVREGMLRSRYVRQTSSVHRFQFDGYEDG